MIAGTVAFIAQITRRDYEWVKSQVATKKMKNTTITTTTSVVRLDFVAGRSDSNISSPNR